MIFIVPAAVLVGFGIGYGLDKVFHTSFLKIVFLLLGVAAGIIDLFRELTKDDAGNDTDFYERVVRRVSWIILALGASRRCRRGVLEGHSQRSSPS